MINKCLYNIFLAVQRTTLAGFGENNGVVYTKIICMTVLYELIKGITVLYNEV